MGKWTLAHTEELCSEKFHTALSKPLIQSGLKLEEFLEYFDPQDQLVQKLIGALVNDAASRRKASKSTNAMKLKDRCDQAARYISHSPHDVYSSAAAARSRNTIRARRRQEAAQAEARGSWILSYPPGDMSDVTSSSSLNLFDAFNSTEPPREEMEPPIMPPETSGEYWWRQTMHANDPPHPYIASRPSPSRPITIVRSTPTPPRTARHRAMDRIRSADRGPLIPGASHPNDPLPRHQRSRSNPAPSSAPFAAVPPIEEDARTDAATVTSAVDAPPQTFIPAEYEHTIASYTPWQDHLRPESYIASSINRMFRSPSPIPGSLVDGTIPPAEDSPWR